MKNPLPTVEELDTCGYAGKWKVAQKQASNLYPEGSELYTQYAIRCFLELGGELKSRERV